MQDGEIKFVRVEQLAYTSLKKIQVTPILAPAIVPLVDFGPMNFMAFCLKLIPLNPGVQDVQNVIERFASGNFWFRPSSSSGQIRVNKLVELFTSNLDWQFPFVHLLWIVFLFHKHVLKISGKKRGRFLL